VEILFDAKQMCTLPALAGGSLSRSLCKYSEHEPTQVFDVGGLREWRIFVT